MEKAFRYTREAAIVETTRGFIRGYEYDGMKIFKGIPYARARRFHSPEQAEAWEGVLDTTSYGYVCPLLEMGRPNLELLVPHRYWVMNEDCLNLNIWTPDCDDRKRPVLVWLHGGGFEAGSAIEQVAYEGENMCKYGDVVVISINHRLNVLGYFDLSDFGEEYANSGNAGMDDIIAALKWIQENIVRFGGDPKNVTVFGQSGGGAKVTTLLQMPAADGLFAKGLNMSGIIGPVLADSTGSGKVFAQAIMKELGTDTVKELEEVPYEQLAAAYRKLRPKYKEKGYNTGGTPHPNAFYKGTPEIHGFREETKHIPMLIGTVYGEFTSFAPDAYDRRTLSKEDGEKMVCELLGEEAAKTVLSLFKEAYPERHPADLLKLDVMFRRPTQEYLRIRAGLNTCTYAYLFNYDFTLDGGRTPWHCSDIPYVFHNTELVPITQETQVTEKLEKQIFESVIAFARTGDPNHDAIPYWPNSTADEEKTMIFDKELRLVVNHDEKLIPVYETYMGEIFRKEFEKNKENVQH